MAGFVKLFQKAKKILQEEGGRIFFKKSLSYIYTKLEEPFIFPYVFIEIKILNKKSFLQVEDFVNFCFSKKGKLIKPIQVKEEILELLKILEKKKPQTILEIGTANGGTLFLFSRIASQDAVIISIDLPEGKFGGGYPKWKIPLYKSFATQNQKIHLIRADSHNQETLEKVKNILGNQKVDFLFIDGDHSYEGVKKDFEMYSPLVRGNGIISLHDIVHHPLVPECQVEKFWREIRNNFQNQEIVKNWQQGGFGIGIIIKNESKGLNNNS